MVVFVFSALIFLIQKIYKKKNLFFNNIKLMERIEFDFLKDMSACNPSNVTFHKLLHWKEGLCHHFTGVFIGPFSTSAETRATNYLQSVKCFINATTDHHRWGPDKHHDVELMHHYMVKLEELFEATLVGLKSRQIPLLQQSSLQIAPAAGGAKRRSKKAGRKSSRKSKSASKRKSAKQIIENVVDKKKAPRRKSRRSSKRSSKRSSRKSK